MASVAEAWEVLYEQMQEVAYRAGRPEAMTWLFGLQNKVSHPLDSCPGLNVV